MDRDRFVGTLEEAVVDMDLLRGRYQSDAHMLDIATRLAKYWKLVPSTLRSPVLECGGVHPVIAAIYAIYRQPKWVVNAEQSARKSVLVEMAWQHFSTGAAGTVGV